MAYICTTIISLLRIFWSFFVYYNDTTTALGCTIHFEVQKYLVMFSPFYYQLHLLIILIPLTFLVYIFWNFCLHSREYWFVWKLGLGWKLGFFQVFLVLLFSSLKRFFEKLIVNFLVSYFKYSHLMCVSVILSWSSMHRVSKNWFSIFSTYSAFEVKDLLHF